MTKSSVSRLARPRVLSSLTILAMLVVPASPAVAEQVDMAEMMARARQYTEPGPQHEELRKFLGRWTTEMRVTMTGAEMPPEKGTTEFSWLIEGRWLQGRGTGTMFGRPADSVVVLGYDNFKKSFRMMTVGSVDTAMLVSEGDLTPSGDALITYGTLDEYLTGEHDKMVRYVWRFLSADEMVLEIHDLPIGETGTKVLETRYRRVAEESGR